MQKPTLYININVTWKNASPTEKYMYVGHTTPIFSRSLCFHLKGTYSISQHLQLKIKILEAIYILKNEGQSLIKLNMNIAQIFWNVYSRWVKISRLLIIALKNV